MFSWLRLLAERCGEPRLWQSGPPKRSDMTLLWQQSAIYKHKVATAS